MTTSNQLADCGRREPFQSGGRIILTVIGILVAVLTIALFLCYTRARRQAASAPDQNNEMNSVREWLGLSPDNSQHDKDKYPEHEDTEPWPPLVIRAPRADAAHLDLNPHDE